MVLMLILKWMSRMARVTQMRAAMKTKVVMVAPTLTLPLRIDLMVICSTKHRGLSEKYNLLDNDLNLLPILSKVGTSMAGGKMHKDLLSPLSPSNCFETLRCGGTALIKCWLIFRNFVNPSNTTSTWNLQIEGSFRRSKCPTRNGNGLQTSSVFFSSCMRCSKSCQKTKHPF
ncbi:hypothetical protein L208DRAFT_1492852 [Tricholoma matsutake]|nr:hypothetical protein L208DRAFT_1492852 [Tricholoma matsutake 945]